MTRRAESPEDLETMKSALWNYIGHRNLIPHSYVDELLLRALEVGDPGSMLELLQHHRECLYYPSPPVIEAYFNHYKELPFEEGLKVYFEHTKGQYFIPQAERFHATMIEQAADSGDGETVVNGYLDILDYAATTLGAEHYLALYESFKYGEEIDQWLFDQLASTLAGESFATDARLKLH